MSWWNRRKKSKLENLCHVCGVNQMPEEPAIIRLKVQEGTAEVLVCDECADFFDKTADVLLKGRKKNDESV
jgi:ribosome-binding protein aMBF1 (putative translation factor)